MSFRTYFMLSSGLKRSLKVPAGTYLLIAAHVDLVERIFGFEREQFKWTDSDGVEHQNAVHWKSTDLRAINPPPDRRIYRGILTFGEDQNEWSWNHPGRDLFDNLVCATAEWHNNWVRTLCDQFGEWSEKPVEGGEELTPDQAKEFWHALTLLDVPVARWTRLYYTARMESLYEVMRGNESEGVTFGAEPLTEKQAAAVINIFAQHLDDHDCRLDVPNGHDYLASPYDGGYDWCSDCGEAIHPDDWPCSKGKECCLQKEMGDEEQDED